MNALLENFNGISNVGDTVKYIERGRDKLTAIISELRKADKRAKDS